MSRRPAAWRGLRRPRPLPCSYLERLLKRADDFLFAVPANVADAALLERRRRVEVLAWKLHKGQKELLGLQDTVLLDIGSATGSIAPTECTRENL